MGEVVVEGIKGFAAALDMSERTVRREMASYPDPLPAKRYRGGVVWARDDRLTLWKRRRFEARPAQGLTLITSLRRIGKFVRLSLSRAKELAPWHRKAPADPLPLWRDASGRVHAYRDALLDWLDRQSAPAAAPRFRRKRWESKLVTERRKRRKADERDEVTGDRARSAAPSEKEVKGAKVRPCKAAA